MKFHVDVDVKGLPTCRYSNTAPNDFKVLATEKGDLMLATDSSFARSICFRDGRHYDGLPHQKGPGDVCTLVFDDFVPGITLGDKPAWYKKLSNRILSVSATADYGPGQGITVSEDRRFGSAIARIRNCQPAWGNSGQFGYTVKITATGKNALDDARALYAQILSGHQ